LLLCFPVTIGCGAAGSATRLAIQPYAHTGGPWVFIARDTSSSAFLDIGYSARQITMKHNGYLGLGNDDPQVDLHITNSSTAKLRVNTTGVADASLEVLGYDAGLHIGDNTNGNRWAIWNDGPSTSSSLKFGSYALGTWYANSSQVMTMTSAGLCGIGTVSPSTKLHILGGDSAIRITPTGGNDPRIDFTDNGGTVRFYTGYDVSSGNFVITSDEGGFGSSNIMVMDDSGNVRVGGGSHYTGTGVTSLTVNDDSYPTFALGSTTSNRYAMIAYSTSTHSYSTTPFIFSIAGNERIKFLNSQ